MEASGRVSLALSVEQSCLRDGELRPPRVLPGGIVRRITGIRTACGKCDGTVSVLDKYIARIYRVRPLRQSVTSRRYSLNGNGAAYTAGTLELDQTLALILLPLYALLMCYYWV